MGMSMVVTRNVSGRVRGFLASSMLEVAPGVYAAPRQSPAVRDRVWGVLEDWFTAEQNASIVFVWQDAAFPAGLAVKRLGLPPLDLVQLDGMILSRRLERSSENEA